MEEVASLQAQGTHVRLNNKKRPFFSGLLL